MLLLLVEVMLTLVRMTLGTYARGICSPMRVEILVTGCTQAGHEDALYIDKDLTKKLKKRLIHSAKEPRPKVRGPTTWTIARHDGPNHLGL